MHLSLCVFLIFVREGDVTRSTRNKGKLWTRADVVPVGEWDCYFTEAYVKNMRPWQVYSPTEKALFVQHSNGRHLSPQAVGDIVVRATVKSGVGRRVSPHTFRHIQAIMGHTSLRSTQVYTHVSIEDLKEAVRRSHPHGGRTGAVKL